MRSAADRGPTRMATFVLIPGAGSDAWHWHLVSPLLEAAGHEAIAVDLPGAPDAGGATGSAPGVGEGLGHRVPTRLIVLVAAMVPAEGESPGDWWSNTRHGEAFREAAARDGRDPDDWDPTHVFLHDVPADVAAQSAQHVQEQSDTPFRQSFPMPPWPDVPTRVLLCRDDRFFPAEFQRRVVAERLGLTPDEMDGGHLPALARPEDLAARLLAYVGVR